MFGDIWNDQRFARAADLLQNGPEIRSPARLVQPEMAKDSPLRPQLDREQDHRAAEHLCRSAHDLLQQLVFARSGTVRRERLRDAIQSSADSINDAVGRLVLLTDFGDTERCAQVQ